MVIDTSAILAILQNEPERRRFNEAIAADSRRLISAATLLEASMVLECRAGDPAGRDLDLFLYRGKFQVVPFDEDLAEVARAAFRRYGKGRHPAALNMGDCFAYALASLRNEPLLFKGADFAATGIRAVLPLAG